MKPSYTSYEMIQFVAYYDVSKMYEILEKHFKSSIGQETFSIVSYSIRDTSPWDFSLMTLIAVYPFLTLGAGQPLALATHNCYVESAKALSGSSQG